MIFMPSTKYFYTETLLDNTGDYVTKAAVDDKSGFLLILDLDTRCAKKCYNDNWTKLKWNPHLDTLAGKLQKFDKDYGGIEIVCSNSDELEDLLNGNTKQLYYVGSHNNTKVLQTVNL